SVFVGEESAVLGVILFGDHGDGVALTFILALEIDGVVTPVGAAGHALGEGSGAGQIGERGGVLLVTLLIKSLRAHDDAQVAKGVGLGVGVCRVSGKFRLISWSRRHRWRSGRLRGLSLRGRGLPRLCRFGLRCGSYGDCEK